MPTAESGSDSFTTVPPTSDEPISEYHQARDFFCGAAIALNAELATWDDVALQSAELPPGVTSELTEILNRFLGILT